VVSELCLTEILQELTEFFHSLLRLITTLDTAIEELSTDTKDALSAEIDNDWAIEGMNGMVPAAIGKGRVMEHDWWKSSHSHDTSLLLKRLVDLAEILDSVQDKLPPIRLQ
jgi:ribosomal protein L11 methylase PrmA